MGRRILIGLLWTALLLGNVPGKAAEGDPAPAAPAPGEAAAPAGGTAPDGAAASPETSAPTAKPTIERIEMAPEPIPPAPAGTAPASEPPVPERRRAAVESPAPVPTDLIRSAEGGDAAAQLELGILYEYGYGMKGRKIEALAWYLAAADQGNAKAIQHRDKLLKQLGSKDVAAAKARSRSIRRNTVTAPPPRATPPPPGDDSTKLGPPAQ